MKHTFHPKHKIKQVDSIDRLALLVGVVQPLMTLPQIYLIYSTQNVTGVSFFMWTGYNVASVILLVYGLKHKLTPIIVAQILWLVVQTPMMVAVFLF
jgi:uncharacterized protein with PQ loop repeat